jgi:type I restriction enzyme S subunit
MSIGQYPKYKKIQFSWLDKAPVHWECKKIAWDLPYVVGWTPPSGKDEYYGGDHPWVTIADMTKGTINDTQSKITDLAIAVKKAEIVPAGSMLFSFKLSVGKVAFLAIDSYTNEAIAAFHPTKDISLAFWKYAAPEIIPNYGRENIYGAKLLNQELIGSARFYCPPRAEQTQIARFLDHETAKIDALIREQERLIELLQEKRNSLTLSAPDSEIWPEERLGNIVQVINRPVSLKLECEYVSIGLYNRGRGLFHKEPKEKKDMGDSTFFWVKPGDLIISGQFAWEGAVALAGNDEAKTVVSHRYPIIRGKTGTVLTEYLFALLTTSHGYYLLKENSRGAAGRNRPLNLNSLLKEKIRIPPINLQKRVANIVNESIAIKQEAENQKQLLLERRSALISAAVTGKIDVRGWKPPADESAFAESGTEDIEATV